MADNPITTPLPADLPTDWVYGQTIGPQGTDVGLAQQYGYNYLMQQVNAAQQAATQIGQAFSGLPSLGSDGKIPAAQLPAMNYDPAGSAATVQDNLTTHINNKSNPHAVTAAQVGADPAGTAAAVQQALAAQIAALTSQLGGKAEIHAFSYVGTGTWGTDAKNSITADKPIVFAAILFRSGSDYDIALSEDQDRNFMLGNALTTSHREGYGFGQRYNSGVTGTYPAGSKSADGKTFYWSWPNDTTTDRSQFQYNKSGVTYYGFYIC